MGRKRKRQANDDAGPQIRKKANGEAVPDGIFHYRKFDDVPWDTQK